MKYTNLLLLLFILFLVGCTKEQQKKPAVEVTEKSPVFVSKYDFDDFKVDEIINESGADLDLSSHNAGNSFRTRIRKAFAEDSTNFAGHYSLVYWGCGTACQSGVIIDRLNRKIFDLPAANSGYDFKPDSRMLFVNAPNEDGTYPELYAAPQVYVLDEASKSFQKLQ